MWCQRCRGGWSSKHRRKQWNHYHSPAGCQCAGGEGPARWGFPCCCVSPPSYCGSGTVPRKQRSSQSTHASGLICTQGQWHTCRNKTATGKTMSTLHRYVKYFLWPSGVMRMYSSGVPAHFRQWKLGKSPDTYVPHLLSSQTYSGQKGAIVLTHVPVFRSDIMREFELCVLRVFFFNTAMKTHTMNSLDQQHPTELSAMI